MPQCICCVKNCKNKSWNSACKFYKFPIIDYKSQQRQKWITAVRKINTDEWQPKPSSVICSDHFIGKKKSDEENSPAYIPSIFSKERNLKNEAAAVNRHARYVKRTLFLRKKLDLPMINKDENVKKNTVENENNIPPITADVDEPHESQILNDFEVHSDIKKYADKESTANIFIDAQEPDRSFTCNRYIYDSKCDAEIQTNIVIINCKSVILKIPRKCNKRCGTISKVFVDQGINCNSEEIDAMSSFKGFKSISKNEQLLDLAGVSFNNFNFLLKRFNDATSGNCKISKENRLLIFLMKIKSGLSFSAISVLFCVHRTTVSRIFFSVLQELAQTTSSLVFWPEKDDVQGTMPQCFYPEYKDTRVIIDCTEFKIEVPATVDNRVLTYSHYKKGFTAKVLIGITPGGFISFKSKVSGGRKSDSQITIESGLIDLLEDGDMVLADKGFPQITRTIDEKGKKVIVIMPPFLEKKSEFTKEETEKTYSIASIRIHVERIMQRLRTYQILSKIPENLFYHIDDIVHVCCVLVNLQPPIISEIRDE